VVFYYALVMTAMMITMLMLFIVVIVIVKLFNELDGSHSLLKYRGGLIKILLEA